MLTQDLIYQYFPLWKNIILSVVFQIYFNLLVFVEYIFIGSFNEFDSVANSTSKIYSRKYTLHHVYFSIQLATDTPRCAWPSFCIHLQSQFCIFSCFDTKIRASHSKIIRRVPSLITVFEYFEWNAVLLFCFRK